MREAGPMELPLETERLVLDEPDDDDLPGLLDVARCRGPCGSVGRGDVRLRKVATLEQQLR